MGADVAEAIPRAGAIARLFVCPRLLVEALGVRSICVDNHSRDRSRAAETSGGILRPSSNPLLIREAVSMLRVFRSRLEAAGFRKDDDPWILRKLYGLDHDAGIPFCLWRVFLFYSELAMEAANGKQIGTYVGMIPSEDSSGGKQRLGHISKQGNSLLRFLLVEAAQAAARIHPDWRRRYIHLAMRRHKSIAKVAMGRRLAIRLYWMWRNGSDYSQSLEFGSYAGQLGTGHGVQ